jgi:DNA primase
MFLPAPWRGDALPEPYLMVEDARGLTALVQMGVLEIHVWGSRADDAQRATNASLRKVRSVEAHFI